LSNNTAKVSQVSVKRWRINRATAGGYSTLLKCRSRKAGKLGQVLPYYARTRIRVGGYLLPTSSILVARWCRDRRAENGMASQAAPPKQPSLGDLAGKVGGHGSGITVYCVVYFNFLSGSIFHWTNP
jgi:hypothetical protein